MAELVDDLRIIVIWDSRTPFGENGDMRISTTVPKGTRIETLLDWTGATTITQYDGLADNPLRAFSCQKEGSLVEGTYMIFVSAQNMGKARRFMTKQR